jgi:ubiquinone/menaquinone biosynthesis C-methylase UbiE
VEHYVLRGGEWGYGRLLLLARVLRPDTVELLHRVGLRPGMRCLDLGCGGGEGTFELARLAAPGGFVVGIDMDEVKLALARQAAAERGLSNLEFRAADVNDWDEPGAYDLVYCRTLLQHLSQPAELLRRMWAAVRAGGVIAVEDADFDGLFCHPPNSGFDFYRRMLPHACALNGGDSTIGRKLYQYFLQVGIPPPELRLVQNSGVTGDMKALTVSTLEASADAIIGAGLATADEVAAKIADLADFAADPEAIIGGPRIFQLWARKTAGPAA